MKRTMDKILVVIAAVLIVFTTTMIVTFWHLGSVPDILITSVFAACLGEFGFMAWIKNTKERTRDERRISSDADADSIDDHIDN